MTRVTPRTLLRCALWIFLLSVGGCAAALRAEEASCASAEKNLPEMTPGAVKNATIVYVNACNGLRAAEQDGGTPCPTTSSAPPSAPQGSR